MQLKSKYVFLIINHNIIEVPGVDLMEHSTGKLCPLGRTLMRSIWWFGRDTGARLSRLKSWLSHCNIKQVTSFL